MHLIGSARRRTAVAVIAVVAATGTALATGVVAAPIGSQASLTDASAQPPGVFVAVSPLRVLDTRPAPEGPIGVPAAAKLGHQQSMDLRLAGDGLAIPATATSAFLNVTIDDDADVQSFLTVWPTGEPRPNTSANNAEPTLVASNSMIAKLGTNGSISIFNQQGAVNVIIDVVGYMVPLETANGPGAQLLSGTAAPASTDGNDGDFYVDTTTGVLYGPKAGGAWPVPGVSLGGVQGAASAYNSAPLTIITAPTVAPQPVTFDTAGPADGSVSQTDVSTFTVAEDGLYTVDYDLDLTLSVVGTIAVFVDGVQTGPVATLGVGTPGVDDTVLVDAEAGNTVQLMFTPAVAGTSINLGSSSVVVQQSTSS